MMSEFPSHADKAEKRLMTARGVRRILGPLFPKGDLCFRLHLKPDTVVSYGMGMGTRLLRRR